MYLLREMSGHKVKKSTLYFDVRHTVYLFAIVYYYRLYVVVKAILIRIVDISTGLKISLFLQTRDHTVGSLIAYYFYASVTWIYSKKAKH